MPVEVVRADITALPVDVVVNAANSTMRGGGGVDGAIHRAGGPAVLADCIARFPSGLATGEAGWTTAGNLPARWIVHVVGPNWHAGQREPELLASCYRNALRVAAELGATSIAFPLVSAGIYGWPLDDAARIAVTAVWDQSSGPGEPRSVADVRMVAYSADAQRALIDARDRLAR
ncbi:MAG TPA: O-acetyl-ADP-ribose deacetylase [Nocardioidaceae bacterium]|nr:O-acetyl-ADP-ribose deacetylase [Nocardioidaceae bacterium]